MEALFAAEPDWYVQLRADEGGRWLLHRAESLLERADATGVTGVVKLGENAGSPGKFENLLAELEMAVLFAQKGLRAELLRDAAFGDRFYAPDLRLTLADGSEVLVEVTRFSDGAPDRLVSEGLRRAVIAERAP